MIISPDDVSTRTAGSNDGSTGFPGVDQTLNESRISAQNRASRSSRFQVGHSCLFALVSMLSIFLERQRLCTSKNLTDGDGQGFVFEGGR